jgi:hypothetical protein
LNRADQTSVLKFLAGNAMPWPLKCEINRSPAPALERQRALKVQGDISFKTNFMAGKLSPQNRVGAPSLMDFFNALFYYSRDKNRILTTEIPKR